MSEESPLVDWISLNKREYDKELVDADQLILLEVVAEKYESIGNDRTCACMFPKNEIGQCQYSTFHEMIGKKLRAILQECNEFHLGKK